MIPKYLVLLTIGMGILSQAKVALIVLYERRENTIVDDFEGDIERLRFVAL